MKKPLVIGWLYPELMATYGDRGNVLILSERIQKRGIPCEVQPIDTTTTPRDLAGCDIVLGGGAQDRQQGIVIDDLRNRYKKTLLDMFLSGVPGLFVCGSPQLLGHWYTTGDGTKLTGLGIFDFTTTHPGNTKPRLIGNTVGRISEQFRVDGLPWKPTVVGFENHGGRTHLDASIQPFATVLAGYGNNGEDGTEGAQLHHCIATYYHGPFLSKNPHIADWLIIRALEQKTGKNHTLIPLDDTYAWHAHVECLKKAGIPPDTA